MNITTKLLTTFLLNATFFIIMFIASVVISRVLGPENFGIYRFVLLVATTIALFCSFGLHEILILKLSQKAIQLKDYLTNVLGALIPLYSVVLCIIFFYISKNETFTDKPLLIACLSFCIIHLLDYHFQPAIYATDRIIKNSILMILKQSTFLILIFVLYFNNAVNLTNIFWVLSFANTFAIIYVLYLNHVNKTNIKARLVISADLISKAIRLYISNILNFMTLNVNIYILRFYVGFYEIGLYALAVTLVEKIWLIPDSVRSVMYLELSNERRGEEFVAQILRFFTFFIIIIGTLLFVTSNRLIIFVFSSEYKDSVLPLLILLPGVLIFGLSRIINAFFIVRELVSINMYASAIIAFTNITLIMLFVPRYGIIGASFASSIAFTIGSVYHIAKFSKESGINILNLLIIKKDDFQLLKLYKTKGTMS